MFQLSVDSCIHKKVVYQQTSLQFVLLETSLKFSYVVAGDVATVYRNLAAQVRVFHKYMREKNFF